MRRSRGESRDGTRTHYRPRALAGDGRRDNRGRASLVGAEHEHSHPRDRVNHRRGRAVGSIALWLVVTGLVAYGFGHVTRTEWVWWLAPITVTLEGSLLFRAGLRGDPAVLSVSELPMFRRSVPAYLVSITLAAWGAFSGHRVALITGAAFAILVRALAPADEPT